MVRKGLSLHLCLLYGLTALVTAETTNGLDDRDLPSVDNVESARCRVRCLALLKHVSTFNFFTFYHSCRVTCKDNYGLVRLCFATKYAQNQLRVEELKATSALLIYFFLTVGLSLYGLTMMFYKKISFSGIIFAKTCKYV